MVSSPILCRPFIGRQQELTFLSERRRAAGAGSGCILLVGGDAGIGKSRLLREFQNTLSHGRAAYAGDHCLQYAARPFGPFLGALKSLNTGNPRVLHGMPHLRRLLADLLPNIGAASADSPHPAASNSRAQLDKWDQLAALAETFDAFAARHTTIVLLEDVHWADAATLELLLYLSERINRSRLMFIVTYRTDELHRDHPLFPALAKLERESCVSQIKLMPLSSGDMQTFVKATLEGQANLPREVVAAVQRRAEGNPFMAEELLKSAAERAAHGDIGEELPLSVRAAIVERLKRFTDAQVNVLTSAAVIGRQFDLHFLASLLECEPQSLLPTLRRARELQLIIEHGRDVECYAFRHALTREAIYKELLAAQTRVLHAKIATALEALPHADAHLSDLAYHWWAVRDGQKSLEFNERAGDAAYKVHAYEDAVSYYERALETAPDGGRRCGELYEKAADALFRWGFPDRARRAYESALRCYRSVGEVSRAAELYKRLARSCYNAGDVTDAIEVAHKALEMLQPVPDDPLNDEFYAFLAYYYVSRADAKAALTELQKVRRAVRDDKPSVAVLYHESKARAHAIMGNLAAWREEVDRLLDAARNTDKPAQLIGFLGGVASVATFLGEGATARENYESAIGLAEELNIPAYVAAFSSHYALERYLRGDLVGARQLLERAIAVPHNIANVSIYVAIAGINIGLSLCDDHFVSRCAPAGIMELAFSTQQSPLFAPLAGAYAQLLVTQKRAGAARDVLHATVQLLKNAYGCFQTLPVIAEHADEADVERAQALLETTGGTPQNRVTHATLAMFQALHASRRGDCKAGNRHAAQAAELYHVLGWPLFEARALEALGEFAAALAIYRRVGDLRAIRRFELCPAEASADPVDHPQRLSERERGVAELIGKGQSNRAIAVALLISEKTVEKHVTSIFDKLGFASRAQLAAHIAAQREAGNQR